MYTVSYKYKIYKQNNNHERKLDKLLSVCCEIYNHAIALNKRFYHFYNKNISKFDMLKHFVKLKKRDHKDWKSISSQTVQSIIENIYNGYERFFKHTAKRPPSFKSNNNFSYIPFKNSGWSFHDNILIINKQKLKLRLFLSRPIEGEIRTVTLKKDKIGDWWAIFVIRKEYNNQYKNIISSKIAGIDFGLLHFLTLNDGTVIDSPQPLKVLLKELKSKSRKFSKTQKGSNNHKRAQLRLAKLHKHIVNQRNDFQWKLALDLVRTYDILCVENLNMKTMQKTWGCKVSDLAYISFLQKLEWECKKHFKKFVKINRFEPTSRICSHCGHQEEKMPLKIREWICPECGSVLNRDVNAARNILRVGASTLVGADIRQVYP